MWRTTRSEMLLGYLGFAQMAPVLFFGIFGGMLADRVERKKVVIMTQTLALLQAFFLFILSFLNVLNTFLVFLLSMILGIINAFDMTCRQAFLSEMVNNEDVGNAIALNSFLFNSMRFLAPPIGGMIIAKYGETPCFGINAFTFMFVLFALLRIKIEKSFLYTKKDFSTSISELFFYLKNKRVERRMLILLGIISFLLLPYAYFLPYFADKVFKGDARTFSYLISSAGIGALIGSLIVARAHKVHVLPKVQAISAFFLSVFLILFSLNKTFVLSLLLLFFVGFCTLILSSATNIFIQTLVKDEMRGRIISLYVSFFVGLPPIGGFLLGTLTNLLKSEILLLFSSLIVLLCSLHFILLSKENLLFWK